MTKILLIGFGGFLGSILRFVIGNWVQGLARTTAYPYGTLAVNLLGCLLIGFLFHLPVLHRQWDGEARLLLITGFLGALTTFSTFGNESLQLYQQEHQWQALSYIGLSLFLGVAAVRLGQLFAEAIY